MAEELIVSSHEGGFSKGKKDKQKNVAARQEAVSLGTTSILEMYSWPLWSTAGH